MRKKEKHGNQKRILDLINDDLLLKKVIGYAYYESELARGVNPKRQEQAHIGNFSESDFDYIHKVSRLVEKRLQSIQWIERTLDKIENQEAEFEIPVHGVRFDDELFKGGRDILRNHLFER